MNFRIRTKNHTADSKMGPPIKSILEPMRLTSPTRQPGSYVEYMLVYENRASKMKFFGIKEIFFINFDFKNEFEN